MESARRRTRLQKLLAVLASDGVSDAGSYGTKLGSARMNGTSCAPFSKGDTFEAALVDLFAGPALADRITIIEVDRRAVTANIGLTVGWEPNLKVQNLDFKSNASSRDNRALSIRASLSGEFTIEVACALLNPIR